MEKIIPLECSDDELKAAIAERTKMIANQRPIKIVVNGELTEYTLVTLRELNVTIEGMQAYRKSLEPDPILAYRFIGPCGGGW